jgi:hypothetical protein
MKLDPASLPELLSRLVVGQDSVRKYDAHQGVPAEMAYLSIAEANWIERGGAIPTAI